MKTLILNGTNLFTPQLVRTYLPIICILIFWWLMPSILEYLDAPTSPIDPAIWQLLLFGIISFITVNLLCWLLVHRFARRFGLPGLPYMVLQFKELTLWQQHVCYLASYALLVLSATGCLIAVF